MSRILYSLRGKDAGRPFSPHCWKVVMALAHKGLEFSERPLPFTAIPQTENGASKTVPLFRDGDRLVRDSFDIALFLEEAYPEHPSLFKGEGGKAAARFVEGYAQRVLHTAITRIAVKDIHDMLEGVDQPYFRQSRETVLGKTLEEVVEDRQAEIAAFPDKLKPLRHMLHSQPFIGGETPLFADYIVFGALQWTRIVTKADLFAERDTVRDWFERCLDLHQELGRTVTAA